MRHFSHIFLSIFFALFSLFQIDIAHAIEKTDPALMQATLTNDQIIKWAEEAATAVNTYSYSTYQQQFKTLAEQYFTSDSWITYLNTLQNSGNLRTVVEKQLTLSAAVNGNSSISQQGIIQGHYRWKVQVPIVINYVNATGLTSRQSFTVTMDIERTANTPQGISIKQFMMSK